MTDPTTTSKHAARYHKDAAAKLCAECGGCRVCRTTRRVGSCENSPACAVVSTATTRPEPLDGRLDPEALTARKRLAAAGRNEEPGTTFGSRWTDTEREELQALYDEHGRREAAVKFVAGHPHRTLEGARYQIDRNLNRRA